MQLFQRENRPDQNQDVGNHCVQNGIIQIILGTVVVNSKQIPVIEDQQLANNIERSHQ